jgi:AcrB/AcrD/AcrF family
MDQAGWLFAALPRPPPGGDQRRQARGGEGPGSGRQPDRPARRVSEPQPRGRIRRLLGLLPIMWSTGAGADVMKRIAAPMVGGLVTSFAMELLVYPAVYYLWRLREVTPGPLTDPSVLSQRAPA